MVGAGRRARLRPQPAARGRAARPGRSASPGAHPTHSHALGATSLTRLRPASTVPGHGLRRLPAPAPSSHYPAPHPLSTLSDQTEAARVQSGSRREVRRSGRWRPRLGSSLGRCARGFLFHRPGPALTPDPRLAAWPRVWSPAPRGSLRPAWTRIRGASVAICQEGRKVQGNQLQIAVLDLRRAPPELEGKQEDAPPGLGPAAKEFRASPRGHAGLRERGFPARLIARKCRPRGSGAVSPRERGRLRRPGRSPGAGTSSVSLGDGRRRRRPGDLRAGGERALWPVPAGRSPTSGGRDPPPPTAA
ncbi:protein CEI [Cebus imitator]|uniref:protein CEI n=1 Tax=Cebus imitator TaxID=2715852 RepID=UPI00189A12D5|nr:protein CEI [Cebus imitator]